MRIFVFLLFTFFSQSSFTCEIETYAQIVILDTSADHSRLIKNTNCANEELSSFINFVQTAQGTVSAQAFQQILPGVELKPSRIRFYNLQAQMNSHSLLPNEAQIVQASQINGQSFIAANAHEQIDFECQSCPAAGEHTLKISVRDVLGGKKTDHWAKVNIGVPVTAFVATRAQQAHLNALQSDGFEIKTIISTNPQEILNSETPIHFFKLSRAISPGETLKRSIVSPIQLVRPGVTSALTVRDSNIVLNGFALPLSYGVWGEVIKLKNQKSSRIIMGKVIDHNKVVVEL